MASKYKVLIDVTSREKFYALQPQGLSAQNISAEADYSCLKANIHAARRGAK